MKSSLTNHRFASRLLSVVGSACGLHPGQVNVSLFSGGNVAVSGGWIRLLFAARCRTCVFANVLRNILYNATANTTLYAKAKKVLI